MVRRHKIVVYLHCVWATRERMPLITEDIEADLYRYIQTVCEDDKCPALAVGGMPDHIHILLEYSNTITLADLMKHIKGGSSRLVTEKLKPGAWFAWQSGYGVFSVSPSHKNSVIRYIHNQKQHHASGKLWPSIEDYSTDEEET